MLEDFAPEIPGYALDMHTMKGKAMGRDLKHFRSESASWYRRRPPMTLMRTKPIGCGDQTAQRNHALIDDGHIGSSGTGRTRTTAETIIACLMWIKAVTKKWRKAVPLTCGKRKGDRAMFRRVFVMFFSIMLVGGSGLCAC